MTPTSGLKCKDLHGYLKSLSPSVLSKLYSHPATCLAVFRELPNISRHYVMRLLFVEQPVPQAVVQSWIDQHHFKKHMEAIETLNHLHIWNEATVPGGLPSWILGPTFRTNLKIALLGGGQAWSVCAPVDKDKHCKDKAFLDTYALERWECVLHFMVGSQTTNEGISADTVRVLQHAKLMKTDDQDSSPTITTQGFQFLLMDTSSQIWYFMLQYLETVESRNLSLIDCLCFLFQLSFLQLGKGYSTEAMSENLLVFLQHLREFGLVYQRNRRSGRFYPTRLAINLASGFKEEASDVHLPGYVVVETNYRVYAYTDSQLQIALLALFCEMLYRFPNLVVAVITRESVRQALRSGITAEQIINFLRMHAHPEMLKSQPPVPPTVMDQIRLWELERDRFTYTEGVQYCQFVSQSDFELLRNYAQDLGVLVWENQAKRIMVVSRSGHDAVKKFWKRNKPQ